MNSTNDQPAKPAGVIYVLHFDKPHHHARHYIGSTESLDRRMFDHATGAGANLLTVLKSIGEHWQLAALYQRRETATYTLREIERVVKQRANGPRLCPLCTGMPKAPRGTFSIPVPQIRSEQFQGAESHG